VSWFHNSVGGIYKLKENISTLENLSIVLEFVDVFPKENSRLPPKRDIDFTIELVPGASLVSKAPYRMSVLELSELKMQLQGSLGKKYIFPSVFPWDL